MEAMGGTDSNEVENATAETAKTTDETAENGPISVENLEYTVNTHAVEYAGRMWNVPSNNVLVHSNRMRVLEQKAVTRYKECNPGD